MKMFAIGGAGDTPIAIPLIYLAKMSLNFIRLFFITIFIASIRAWTLTSVNHLAWSLWENQVPNLCMHSSVGMLGYIEMASYMKRDALGGTLISASIFLRAKELGK